MSFVFNKETRGAEIFLRAKIGSTRKFIAARLPDRSAMVFS
jgi:hypothetical protein